MRASQRAFAWWPLPTLLVRPAWQIATVLLLLTSCTTVHVQTDGKVVTTWYPGVLVLSVDDGRVPNLYRSRTWGFGASREHLTLGYRSDFQVRFPLDDKSRAVVVLNESDRAEVPRGCEELSSLFPVGELCSYRVGREND